MRTLFTLSCLLLLNCHTHAQWPLTPLWTYSDDAGIHAVLSTSDNGCIVLGSEDSQFVRLDADGNAIATHAYEDSMYMSFDKLVAGCKAVGGGYILTSLFGQIVRTDSMRNALWTSRPLGWQEPEIKAITARPDSGFMICGTTEWSPYAGYLFVARFDSGGQLLWSQSYDSLGLAIGFGITTVNALAGTRISGTLYDESGYPQQNFVAALYSSGNLSWFHAYDWGAYSLAGEVIPDHAGVPYEGCLVCGISNGFQSRLALSAIEWNSTPNWFRTYGYNIGFTDWLAPRPCSVYRTLDGGILAAANWWPYDVENPTGMLWRFDEQGNEQWSAYMGDFSDGYLINDVAQSPDSSIFVCGSIMDNMAFLGSFVAKLPPSGFVRAVEVPPLPASSALLAAYPNPFNGSTVITLNVSRLTQASLNVYNALGRQIATLNDGILEPGVHRFTFDASALPSGIYFARVQAGEFVKTQKLLLLK